ncbi:MAG: shikimate kinase [Candidatus Bathyarchaeota archaeon]
MNVALIGFMATGKTSVGRILADRLGYMFVDTDEEIVRRTGQEIVEIFASEGETVFRALEKSVVAEASASEKTVIACGGGVVLDQRNVDALRSTSRLVLLTASVDETLDRVTGDGSRPLLNVGDREKAVTVRLEERMLHYLKATDAVVDTTGLTLKEVADRVIQLLEAEG